MPASKINATIAIGGSNQTGTRLRSIKMVDTISCGVVFMVFQRQWKQKDPSKEKRFRKTEGF
jgi:hypothetical protein